MAVEAVVDVGAVVAAEAVEVVVAVEVLVEVGGAMVDEVELEGGGTGSAKGNTHTNRYCYIFAGRWVT